MARRKHEVMVTITFDEEVSEKVAKGAVEALINLGTSRSKDGIHPRFGGITKIAYKSATRQIAALKAAIIPLQ